MMLKNPEQNSLTQLRSLLTQLKTKLVQNLLKQQVVMAIKSKEIVSMRRKLKWRRWKIGFRKGTRRIREAMSKRMNQTRRMRTLCPSNR